MRVLKRPMPSPAADGAEPPALIGQARLMTMAFHGADLRPVAATLINRAGADASDANALMDLSTVLLLRGLRNEGLAVQSLALGAARCYELCATRSPAVRLLAIMTAGDLMANAPLPFLFEDSDIALTMLYVEPGRGLPDELPEHDVVFVAILESEATLDLLESLEATLATSAKPVLNRPRPIALTSRAEVCVRLAGIPHLVMPPTLRATRARLQAATAAPSDAVVETLALPLIIRPVDSHAGIGLSRVATLAEVDSYLQERAEEDFFIAPFIDYRSADGLFRKFRIVVIDGVPFAAHMAISSHWMIHYLNAGMIESAAKRAEEAAFMATFGSDFAVRHGTALAAIAARSGLDFLVLDCAETPSGELLLFEIDPGAVVHSMDPDELFPYKRATMALIYAAFRAMLVRAAGRSAVASSAARTRG